MEGLRLLEVDVEFFRKFSSGWDQCTFRISEGKVAKFGSGFDRWPDFARERIESEYETARELYDGGISVPEPLGIFAVSLPADSERISVCERPALITRYIDGTIRRELGKQERDEMIQFVMDEVERAKNLGFKPGPDVYSPDNSILGRDGKGYLIDFEQWGRVVV